MVFMIVHSNGNSVPLYSWYICSFIPMVILFLYIHGTSVRLFQWYFYQFRPRMTTRCICKMHYRLAASGDFRFSWLYNARRFRRACMYTQAHRSMRRLLTGNVILDKRSKLVISNPYISYNFTKPYVVGTQKNVSMRRFF